MYIAVELFVSYILQIVLFMQERYMYFHGSLQVSFHFQFVRRWNHLFLLCSQAHSPFGRNGKWPEVPCFLSQKSHGGVLYCDFPSINPFSFFFGSQAYIFAGVDLQ